MKKTLCLILTVLLLLGCFSGCQLSSLLMLGVPALILSQTGDDLETPSIQTEAPSVTKESASPTQAPENDPSQEGTPTVPGKRKANGGWRDYAEDGYVDMVPFDEMPYERPDVDALCAEFEALTEMAERGEDAEAILQAYYTANDHYLHFYTMDSLAYIRYTLNTNDSYYKEEYDALELASPDVEEKLEAFNKACAHSKSRKALEDAYFGEDYFADYEEFSRYTNEEFLALSKEEEALMAEYRSALEDPQIEYNGKVQSFNDLMEKYTEITTYKQFQEYLAILKAYYSKYNQSVGEIFIKLVKIRQKIAKVLDYESYADYCYDLSYGRDYTHEDGVRFLEEVRTELVPVYNQLVALEKSEDYDQFSLDTSKMTAGLQSAVKNMDQQLKDGRMEEAFNFMTAYRLYDIETAPEKFDSSFTTYLYDYESPFLTVNSQGNSGDYLTFSHEFGHFTDYYLTYDAAEDLETAETFSQAMEFLSLCYTQGIFTERQRSDLLHLNLLEVMDTFTYQGALASFEDQVYALPENQLTVKKINELYYNCCRSYGNYSEYYDFYYRQGWINVTHFFEVPYYVISYCVSADTALQIYLLEAEHKGDGLAVYCKLFDREPGAGVQSVLETAGLGNPFRKGGLKEIADFYREAFDLS